MKSAIAAIIFFTRIPLWRITKVPPQFFRRIVGWWPLAGLITAGVMVGTWWLAAMIFPHGIALAIAIGARIVFTGALHEDGLADFFDGFGGGASRTRILEIMKDSHIGSYGVLGLILYILTLWLTLCAMPASLLPWIIFAGDPWAKFCAGQLINFLPYCRTETEAKNGTVYSKSSIIPLIGGFLCAILPAFCLPINLFWAYLGPILTVALLILYLRYKIQGYTGDCCGAAALFSELSFYLICIALK